MASNMGFKSKVVEATSVDGGAAPPGAYSFNAEQIGDYDCKPRTAEALKFILPLGITFAEVK